MDYKTIGISGNPGTGKKTIAKLLANRINYELIILNDFAKENNALKHISKNTEVVDEEVVRKKLKNRIAKKTILAGHFLADVIDQDNIDIIIVLRCSPKELIKRYTERKYEKNKIKNNLITELIGLIAYECIEKFGKKKIFELNTTDIDPEETVKIIKSILDSKEHKKNNIDWTSEYINDENLRKYII